MDRRHALVISIFLGIALLAGSFAAIRTTQLGAQATVVPAAQIAAKNRQLDRYEATLRREARTRPPSLPALPAKAGSAGGSPAPQVIYQRPPAIIQVVHSRHGDEHEQEHEGGEVDD
jgi:hypothetical protein